MTPLQKAVEAKLTTDIEKRIAEVLPCHCKMQGKFIYADGHAPHCLSHYRPAVLALVEQERKRVLEEACRTQCQFCREGNTPGKNPDFCQPQTFWHRIYDNWLACPASAIRALAAESASDTTGGNQ